MSAPEFVEPAGEVRLRFTHRGVVDDPPSFLFILPVLFVEFLAIAVTRSLLPSRLNAFFGDGVYYVIGNYHAPRPFFSRVTHTQREREREREKERRRLETRRLGWPRRRRG